MARASIGSLTRWIGGLGPKPPEYTGSWGARLVLAAPTRNSAGCAAAAGPAPASASATATATAIAAPATPRFAMARLLRGCAPAELADLSPKFGFSFPCGWAWLTTH